MKSRALSIATLLPALLLAAACHDEPVQPTDASASTNVSQPPGAQIQGAQSGPAVAIFRVSLAPLNNSGVHGTATLAVRGSDLVVQLQAVGHIPDLQHVQHIHGFTDGTDATCPPPSAAGDDGVLTFAEGLPFYGPVQLNLTPFPTPTNSAGSIQYHASFASADLAFSPSDLELKTMVLHGAFVDGTYVPSLPVACGVVERVN
ncbi:MAG TPA: hypothetical protein VFW89_10285 [Gemmatimonadaceae bacterium]|nr:hypothetical protein [Gemmatimonadaceae bacterium]